jgi:hypothetical protein
MTEDRFKDMSDLQWLIHYKMVEKEKRDEMELKTDLIKTVLEVVFENLDAIALKNAAIIAPANYAKLDEFMKNKSGKASEELKEMEDFFENLKASGELDFDIELELKRDDDSPILPVQKRKLGIQIQGTSG